MIVKLFMIGAALCIAEAAFLYYRRPASPNWRRYAPLSLLSALAFTLMATGFWLMDRGQMSLPFSLVFLAIAIVFLVFAYRVLLSPPDRAA